MLHLIEHRSITHIRVTRPSVSVAATLHCTTHSSRTLRSTAPERPTHVRPALSAPDDLHQGWVGDRTRTEEKLHLLQLISRPNGPQIEPGNEELGRASCRQGGEDG